MRTSTLTQPTTTAAPTRIEPLADRLIEVLLLPNRLDPRLNAGRCLALGQLALAHVLWEDEAGTLGEFIAARRRLSAAFDPSTVLEPRARAELSAIVDAPALNARGAGDGGACENCPATQCPRSGRSRARRREAVAA